MSGSVARRAGVAAPAVRGWGRQERVTKKASALGGHVTTPRESG